MQTQPLLASVVVALTLAACQTNDDIVPMDPDADLPDPESGKADGVLLGPLRERLNALIQNFSATTNARFYNTPEAALAEIGRRTRAAGIASPSDAIYMAEVATFQIDGTAWNHSEVLIHAAIDLDTPRKLARLDLRTVGDPNGAGVFEDQHITSPLGPRLCLTWNMLQAVVRAAYVPGVYSQDYVCHTITGRVLASIQVAPESYQPRVGGWKLARWIFGPWFNSGISQDTREWQPVGVCQDFASQITASGFR